MSDRLPPPPTRFPVARDGDIVTLTDSDSAFLRVYPTSGPYPMAWNAFRTWGPIAGGRFDPHPPPPPTDTPSCGVMYAAVTTSVVPCTTSALHTAVAETFQMTRVVQLGEYQRYAAVLAFHRPPRLLNLVNSTWLTRAGGNAAIASGDRSLSRQWAHALHRHRNFRTHIDGLLYPSSVVPGGVCAVLWSQGTQLATHPQFNRPLTDPAVRADVMTATWKLGYHLDVLA